MDSNGYNPSLLDTEDGICYLCHTDGQTVRHEIYMGAGSRSLSKRYGLWVNLCPACHMEVHAEPKGRKAVKLDKDAETAFLAQGHPEEEFIRIFKKGEIKWWEIK